MLRAHRLHFVNPVSKQESNKCLFTCSAYFADPEVGSNMFLQNYLDSYQTTRRHILGANNLRRLVRLLTDNLKLQIMCNKFSFPSAKGLINFTLFSIIMINLNLHNLRTSLRTINFPNSQLQEKQ
jgi:hypothetical protein